MRGKRFAGLLAGGMLLCAASVGSGPAAAEGLPTDLSTGNIIPSSVSSVLPLPSDEPVEIPLPDTPVTGGGDPTPASSSSGGSGGSGESGGAGQSRTDDTGSAQSRSADGTGRSGSGSETAEGLDTVTGPAPTTLMGSAGMLASNIGRLAKPLGIPLGLAFVGAVILLIAIQRPVALRKVEEEGPWGYERRSHRL